MPADCTIFRAAPRDATTGPLQNSGTTSAVRQVYETTWRQKGFEEVYGHHWKQLESVVAVTECRCTAVDFVLFGKADAARTDAHSNSFRMFSSLRPNNVDGVRVELRGLRLDISVTAVPGMLGPQDACAH